MVATAATFFLGLVISVWRQYTRKVPNVTQSPEYSTLEDKLREALLHQLRQVSGEEFSVLRESESGMTLRDLSVSYLSSFSHSTTANSSSAQSAPLESTRIEMSPRMSWAALQLSALEAVVDAREKTIPKKKKYCFRC
jgi:hypothetical protein